MLNIQKTEHLETLIGSLNKMIMIAKNRAIINNKELSLLNMIFKILNSCNTLCESDRFKLVSLYYQILNKYNFLCKGNLSLNNNTYINTNLTNEYINKDSNTPPTISDFIIDDIELDLDLPFLFTRNMFTYNYYDKENDLPNNIMITSLPTSGTLYFNDIPVTVNLIFNISEINNLKYIRNSEISIIESFTFKLSDNNINSLFSSNTSITLNFNQIINLPPDIVGNNNKIIIHQDYILFSKEDFTTQTFPIYHDPELDEPYKLKILSLPIYGELTYDDIAVEINQEILLSTLLEEKQLIYKPLDSFDEEYTVEFNYAVSDIGSMQYTE